MSELKPDMTDLITEAREQIAHLNGAKLAFEQNGLKTAVGIMVNTAAILDRLCDALEKAEAENRWIPVGEMLPTVSEYRNGDRYKSMDSNEFVPFLVCCEDTEIPFRAFYDGKNWGDGWGKQNVTHWRPLPEPPKGE